MRIKGAASWGLNEARLWVMRPVTGLPDTGSNPAQMGIEVSYDNGVLRENSIECVSGVGNRKVCRKYLQGKLSQGM